MRLRAPTLDEASAVSDMLRARDTADFGAPDCTLEDVLDEWRASDFDLSSDARVCEDEEGRIVAYASVRRQGTYLAVAPDREGLGAGTLLLEWAEQRQRAVGWERLRQATAASNVRAKELLERAGYSFVRSHWRMAVVLDGTCRRAPHPRA